MSDGIDDRDDDEIYASNMNALSIARTLPDLKHENLCIGCDNQKVPGFIVKEGETFKCPMCNR